MYQNRKEKVKLRQNINYTVYIVTVGQSTMLLRCTHGRTVYMQYVQYNMFFFILLLCKIFKKL